MNCSFLLLYNSSSSTVKTKWIKSVPSVKVVEYCCFKVWQNSLSVVPAHYVLMNVKMTINQLL